MKVAVAKLKLHLSSQPRSLKDKRRILLHLKDKIKVKFHVVPAEVEDNQLWQIATLGFAFAASDFKIAEAQMQKILAVLEQEAELEIIEAMIDYFDY